MCRKKRTFNVFISIVSIMFLLSVFNISGQAAEKNNLTPIMGQAQLSKQQVLEYFKFRNSDRDAKCVKNFIDIVWEEGTLEGVRPDLAFIQMMLETDFLKFKGDVKEEQNNFGGIGATGAGNSGESFPDIRTGIRVNVQHLKAYASTEKLVQGCVYPRFNYVERGITPNAEWLGIGSNPEYL